jgi:transcriptional regulator with XRE-family HTH domain
VEIIPYHNSHPAKKVKSQKANGTRKAHGPAFKAMPRRTTTAPRTELGRRLLVSRLALGCAEQGKFAEEAGIGANTYNAWETGARRLTQNGARLLRDKYQLPLEWLIEGVPDRLPHGLFRKIEAIDPNVPPAGSGQKIIRNLRI